MLPLIIRIINIVIIGIPQTALETSLVHSTQRHSLPYACSSLFYRWCVPPDRRTLMNLIATESYCSRGCHTFLVVLYIFSLSSLSLWTLFAIVRRSLGLTSFTFALSKFEVDFYQSSLRVLHFPVLPIPYPALHSVLWFPSHSYGVLFDQIVFRSIASVEFSSYVVTRSFRAHSYCQWCLLCSAQREVYGALQRWSHMRPSIQRIKSNQRR